MQIYKSVPQITSSGNLQGTKTKIVTIKFCDLLENACGQVRMSKKFLLYFFIHIKRFR